MTTGAVPCPLTPRQREVLGALARGLTCKEAALALHMAYATAHIHTSGIRARLHTRNTTGAAVLAVQAGWIEPADVLTDWEEDC